MVGVGVMNGAVVVGHCAVEVTTTVTVVPTVCATVCVCHVVIVLAGGQVEVGAAPQPLACKVIGKHFFCPKSGLM